MSKCKINSVKCRLKFFHIITTKTLLTSLFYSKLYYGSEIWHLPGRSISQNKKLKFASANALRSLDRNMTIYNTHTQIHSNAKRALPDQMLNYKHALTMHKLFNTCQPEQEFINLNFQLNMNPRIQHVYFFTRQNYDTGKNIMLNRFAHLNNKIETSWLQLSLDSFKIKCKALFLNN